MSDSASFGGIVSQGVQDVAALLPLLGTEQCKKHVSLSFKQGYLYAAVAPLSIFGSLGIALAGLWIGLASTAWGVRLLKDAGFEPSSVVAKIITLDDRRYLAETNLIAALEGLQMQGLQNRGRHMQIKFKDRVALWNVGLVISSLIAAGVSLSPYFHFIIFHDTSSPLRAWIFPAIRAMGGVFCVVGGQQLLQKRILTIIQQRLDFMYISQLLDKEKIDVRTMLITPPRHIWPLRIWRATPEKLPIQWDPNRTSEECLQDLDLYLKSHVPKDDSPAMAQLVNARNISTSLCDNTSERFPKKYVSQQGLYRILVAIGVLASVVGYIGSFSLVQDNKASPRGRYLWIGLEALLAVIRTMIWASNPSFDELRGLQLRVELSDKVDSPCNTLIPLMPQGEADSKPMTLADSNITHPKLEATRNALPCLGDPIIDGETFCDAFIKYSGFLPPLKAKSIVPYYTIFESRLCIAFETQKPNLMTEGVFFLDSRSNGTTPFTLYHAVKAITTAEAAAETAVSTERALETETAPANETALATQTAATTAATVKDKPELTQAEPDGLFNTDGDKLASLSPLQLQELTMQSDFINNVLTARLKIKDLKPKKFDVGWLVHVEYFLSHSKDPYEAWKPVRKRAEKLMGNLQDDAVTSNLIYSGNQALYFYHEKMRCYYGDETSDGVLASHYFTHVTSFFSEYVKHVRNDIELQPDLMNNRYQEESEKYTMGVDRVEKLLFSWKSWQWYRRYLPGTDFDQADLDGTVRDLAHRVWNSVLHDAIASDGDGDGSPGNASISKEVREDFTKNCKKLPVGDAPEDGTLSEVEGSKDSIIDVHMMEVVQGATASARSRNPETNELECKDSRSSSDS